jgi:hypothetical protein
MEVKPGYENVFTELVAQLGKLREKFKDDTGKPVRIWDTKDYN